MSDTLSNCKIVKSAIYFFRAWDAVRNHAQEDTVSRPCGTSWKCVLFWFFLRGGCVMPRGWYHREFAHTVIIRVWFCHSRRERKLMTNLEGGENNTFRLSAQSSSWRYSFSPKGLRKKLETSWNLEIRNDDLFTDISKRERIFALENQDFK